MDAGMTGNIAAPQFSIAYDNLLGIDDELLSNGVRLYPIPATNSITINANTSLKPESSLGNRNKKTAISLKNSG